MASQTITGPDLQYTQDNKRCFGYSGVMTVDNNETAMLGEVLTGSEYIVAEWAVFYIGGTGASDDYAFALYFDDIKIASVNLGQQRINDANVTARISRFIIPPFTRFKLTGQNVADTSENTIAATVTGRVHAMLAVRN